MKIECKYCGKEFQAKPSSIKRGKKYCSKDCYDKAQFKGVKTTCFHCQKEIKLSPSLVCKHNFCSNECRIQWLKQDQIKKLNIKGHSAGHKAPHLTRLNKERNPKIAIQKCKVRRGQYKGKEHRRIVEQVIGRKLLPNEDVHHINGIRDDNRLENLGIINHSEHLKLHWRLAKERGWF